MTRDLKFMVITAVGTMACSVLYIVVNPDDFRHPAYLPFMGVIAIVTGAWLYWCRSRHRLAYGLVEMAAGVVTVIFALKSFGDSLPRPLAFEVPMLPTYLSLAGGLYIIVRGFDNIGQGLTKGSKIHQMWSQLFG